VLVSFISPFRAERQMARERVGDTSFVEVYVETSIEVAESRDPKGLYAKARRGELSNFTGVDSPYEPPERPELRVDTTTMTATDAAEHIFEHLAAIGVLRGS
jgi:bifunctional enzyme CysN/CysC